MFALSADEATDVSNTEQLAVVLRTVSSRGTINERLLEYIDLESITGSAVATALLDCLEKHNINIEDCRVQTYDGAANMSGTVNGCQALIKEKQPLAVYNHCSSHRHNLALNSTTKIAEFKILIVNIKRLGIFFTYSPKRTRILEKILSEAQPPVSQKKIKVMCETRWVERHTNRFDLLELYPHILESLHHLISNPTSDSKTLTDAQELLTYLQSAPFIVALVISKDMLGYKKQLCGSLQGSTADIKRAYDDVEVVVSGTRKARGNTVWLTLVEKMERLNGEPLTQPRRAGRQTLRANYDTNNAKDYYKVSLFYPYIDYLLADLTRRFQESPSIPKGLCLVPAILREVGQEEYSSEVRKFVTPHVDSLPSPDTIVQELQMWWEWNNRRSDLTSDLKAAYKLAISSIKFPNISYLLKILLTMPVTSATTERANFTLKFIKSKLRSRMSQTALNAFVLAYKHKDLLHKLKAEDMANSLILMKRRLLFHNPLSN